MAQDLALTTSKKHILGHLPLPNKGAKFWHSIPVAVRTQLGHSSYAKESLPGLLQPIKNGLQQADPDTALFVQR